VEKWNNKQEMSTHEMSNGLICNILFHIMYLYLYLSVASRFQLPTPIFEYSLSLNKNVISHDVYSIRNI